MSNSYIVCVFNTITSSYENIQVTQATYNEYRRGEWRINKNDDKHKANEIPFSALVGGEEGSFENFSEFADYENTPEIDMQKSEKMQLALNALKSLSKTTRRRFLLRYMYNLNISEIAIAECVSEYTVRGSLKLAKKNLDKFFQKKF